MAITKLVSAVTPNPKAINAGGDWDLAMAQLTAVKIAMGGQQMILTEWLNTVNSPKIAQGSYITHLGAIYIVDTEDYAITAPTIDVTYYIRVSESVETLELVFIEDLAEYAWNSEYNGLYHADGSQVLAYQLNKLGDVFTKRKILNPVRGGGFLTVDYTGMVVGTSSLSVPSLNTGSGPMTFNQGVKTTDNVGFVTVDTGQGANKLFGMNQGVKTTDNVGFASVDTGQGANKLFRMNQNVRGDSHVHFANINPPIDNLDTTLPAIGIGGCTVGFAPNIARFTMPAGGYYMVLRLGEHEAYTTGYWEIPPPEYIGDPQDQVWVENTYYSIGRLGRIERLAGGAITSYACYSVLVFRLS